MGVSSLSCLPVIARSATGYLLMPSRGVAVRQAPYACGSRCRHRVQGIEWSHACVLVRMACLGNPDPVDMKVYCPTGKETFDDEKTQEAPSRGDRCEAA